MSFSKEVPGNTIAMSKSRETTPATSMLCLLIARKTMNTMWFSHFDYLFQMQLVVANGFFKILCLSSFPFFFLQIIAIQLHVLFYNVYRDFIKKLPKHQAVGILYV